MRTCDVRQCLIVVEEDADNDLSLFPEAPVCKHSACHNCWKRHTHAKLDEGRWPIPCIKCSVNIEDPRFFKMNPNLVRRIEEITFKRDMQSQQGDWVACPFGCHFAVSDILTSKYAEADCETCHRRFCLICKRPAHMQLQCPPNDEIESALWKTDGDELRRCPNPNCQEAIVKSSSDDCDKVSCRSCGISFCFRCGKTGCKSCTGDDHVPINNRTGKVMTQYEATAAESHTQREIAKNMKRPLRLRSTVLRASTAKRTARPTLLLDDS